MDELIRHGLDARKDWEAYHSAVKSADPRYHNRPDCADGSLIGDDDIRAGTDMRPLCEKCRSTEKPAADSRTVPSTWQP